MKKNFVFLLLFVSTLFLVNCKKSQDKPKSTGIVTSYWYGTFQNGIFSINQGIALKDNGSCVVYDFFGTNITDTVNAPYKGYGTYTITGKSISYTDTFPTSANDTFNSTGTINTNVTPNTMSGTYTLVSGGSASGSFLYTKQ